MNKMFKKLLALAVVFTMVFSMVPATAFATVIDADLVISTADELKAFADEVNNGNSYQGKTVALANDIDLEWTAVVIGTKTNSFKGTFDGQGYTVQNLNIYECGAESDYFADTDDCVGLFGVINTPAVVKNVTVSDPYVVGSSYVGAIVGMAYTGTIENCHVVGEIDIEGVYMVGGITGHGYARIYDCSVIGEEGWDYNYIGASYQANNLEGDNVGGIVGHNAENNTISGCTVKNVTVSGTRKVGGIVGITAQSTDITNCAVVDVIVETTATEEYANANTKTMSIGGIVGQYMANSQGVGGELSNCKVEGLSFANENGVTVNAGALTGGVRASSGTTFAPAEGNIVTSGNAVSKVEGENVNYMEPEVVKVATYDELVAALANGGEFALANDITVDTRITVIDGTVIDLKGNTLYINVENSTWGNAIVKNGNIVLGKDDVNVCDGYFLVNAGKTLIIDGVKLTSSADGIKGYAVFHLKTGANLDLINSQLNIADNAYEPGYIVYAGEATATVDIIGSTVIGTNVNGIVHATTVIEDSVFTVDANEHGINRSGVTITDSVVTICNGYGRGITAQNGDLIVDGNSVVTISKMDEASIELRNNKNLTIADTATVQVDKAVNNTTSGAITGNVNSYVSGLNGSGTEADPFLINTLDELKWFRDSVNAGNDYAGKVVALNANIDMAGIDWSVNIGDDCNATFDGIFDGKGYTIYNLNSTETAQKADGYICTGLFGAIAGNAVIKNLTIENVTINTGDFTGNNVGAVVGFAYNATGSIENVTVKGNIQINANKVDGVGAIVGYAYNGKLTVADCVVDGAVVNGQAYVGGVIGYAGGQATLSGNNVQNLTVNASSCCAGGVAGLILGGGVASDNTVKNATLTSAHANWKNAVGAVTGTFTGTITVSGTVTENNSTEALVGVLHANKPTAPLAKAQAAIGDVYYGTLEAALAAAEDGDTIILLAPVVVKAGETLILDKAVTITYTSNAAGEDMITNNGTLIVDGATLKYVNTDTTASNVTVSTISCAPGSVLEVKSGAVINNSANNGALGIYAYAIDMLTNGSLGDVTATISGGEVSCPNYMAIRQFNNGNACKNTLNVTGGKIYGGKRAIQIHFDNNAAYLTISGGAVEAGNYALCLFTTYENVVVTGGEFSGEVWYAGTESFISGGAFDTAVEEAYIAEGYKLVANEGGYTVLEDHELPSATVTEIENEDLTFAMNFKVDPVTQVQLAYYGNWFADFELTINKDVAFNADGTADGWLSGQYDEWSENWVNVPFGKFAPTTIKANEPLRIMAFAAELMGEPGLKYTYQEVYEFVRDFNCGVFFDDEFLAANPDLEVKLELKMYNPANEAESYVIGETYTYKNPVVAQNTTTNKAYETLNEALLDCAEGQTVILLKDVTEKVITVFENTTLDLNGHTVATGYVSSFGDIIDSSAENTGLLEVAPNRIMLRDENKQLPVRDGDGYRFVEVMRIETAYVAAEKMFAFQPHFELSMLELMKQSQDLTGVTIEVQVSWKENNGRRTQNFVYTDEFVKIYLNSQTPGVDYYGQMFTLILDSTDGFEDLTFTAVAVSNTGVSISSAARTV